MEVLNAALTKIPSDRIRLHLRWGNYECPHHRDIPLDSKVTIPGVIDSTTNFIEHPELVVQRIVRCARLVGRKNVIPGSDCGFGTFVRTNPAVAPDLVWHKLQAIAGEDKIASNDLW